MTAPTADQLIGRTAVDADGDKIGKIGQVYLGDRSGQPEWVSISTGLFGTRQSFAPLSGATPDGDDVRLAVRKDLVKDAPQIDDDGHLDDADVDTLYTHYSTVLGQGGGTTGTTIADAGTEVGSDTGAARGSDVVGGPGRDVSGPNTDDAMTRSEERLDVGTERVETGRARLRKYVVTENVQTTVPVSHEEVRVEREPITEANRDAAYSGADLTEEEHEVTLHAERPVVDKETVPVERVRLDTDTVRDEQVVDEQVRKEQIDVDGADER